MHHKSTLVAIRSCSVEISNNISDQEVISIINCHFLYARLDILASHLQQAALLFGFTWESSFWEFSVGTNMKPLIVMRYEAYTIHGNILLERIIALDGTKIFAKHSYFEVPDLLQENGLSRFINRILYNFYNRINIKIIRLYASLDVGGYVWAVAGFAATSEAEVQKIINKAWGKIGPKSKIVPATLDIIERHLLMHSSMSKGKPYPIYHWIALAGKEQAKEILLDSNWHGELNFDDNVQLSSFGDYINKDQSLIKPW